MATLNEQLAELQVARDDMKSALTEKGQTVTKDIRTYAEAISKIVSGSSNENSDTVKHYVFSSTAEAEAFANFKFGDTAVILEEQKRPVNIKYYDTAALRRSSANGKQSIWWYCQPTVTLPELTTYSDSVTIEETSGNKTNTWTFGIELTETSCVITLNFTLLGDEGEGTAKWVSTDGLTYTFEGRTNPDNETLTNDYFMLGAFNYSVEVTDTCASLLEKAIINFTKPELLSVFLYTKAKDVFNGFWQVGAEPLIDNKAHVLDLYKCHFPAEKENVSLTYQREEYDVSDKISIIEGAGFPSSRTYGGVFVDLGDKAHIIWGSYIHYFIDEHLFTLGKDGINTSFEHQPIYKIYDYTTKTYTTGTSQIELPADAKILSFHMSIDEENVVDELNGSYSIDVYQNKNSTSEKLYYYYAYNKGTKYIAKNDFGMFTENSDIAYGKYAFANNGLIIGSKL